MNSTDFLAEGYQCKTDPEYCKGYDKGYNDETDFLG
jgi:hypothetical protein